MNGYELHRSTIFDDRTAILCALILDGWPHDEALALIAKLSAPATERQGWSRFTDEQVEYLQDVINEYGGKLPPSEAIRNVADGIGRSPRSVQSKMERMIR